MDEPVTRRYLSDAEYDADAAEMVAAGWLVVSFHREPSGAIVASYAQNPAVAPSQALRQARPWYRSAMGVASIVGGAVFLGAMTIAVFLGVQFVNSPWFNLPPDGLVPSSVATNQAFTASLDATATANAAWATATPRIAGVTGPYLGAPISAFDTIFGPEQGARVWYTTLNGQSVRLTAQTTFDTMEYNDAITTPDGLERVWTLSVTFMGRSAPTLAQSVAICRQFMPTDAKHIRDNTNSTTLEHIYHSQLLAASFDQDAFQNTTGHDVTPGTFDVFYSARSCSMSTGQE